MKISVLLLLLFVSINLSGQDKSKGFIENKGQIVDETGKVNERVLYLLNTRGLNVQLRKDGFSYDVYEPAEADQRKVKNHQSEAPQFHFQRIDIDFVGCNSKTVIKAGGKSSDYDHYYTNPGGTEGILFVHSYKMVTYYNIYNGIDVVFFIPENLAKPVEYNFIIHPHGKADDIQMRFRGAKTSLQDNKISMALRFGTMEEILPLSWE